MELALSDIPDVPNSSKLRRTFGKTFISLRHRNFKLYFYGQLVSNSGNWLTNVALVLLILKFTKSGFDVGLLTACQFGPILLMSAWAGAIVDRKNKRKFLMLTQTLEMLQSAGLATLAFMHHPPVIGFYILATLGGIFLAFDNPLRRSFVSEMVPQEDVSNAVVLYSIIVNGSRIVGPALAGLLVISVGYGWCFTVDALSYIAVLYSLYAMKVNELYLTKIKPKVKGEIRAGFAYIRKVPELWISFVMLAVIGTLAYNFQVTLPLFVHDSLHKTDVTYTVLYIVFSIGAVLSSLVIAQRQMVKMRHIVWGAVGLGISMILLGLSTNIVLASTASLLVGITAIVYTTSTTTMVQLDTEASIRGRVLALQTVLMIGTTPIGGPILGWLADETNGRVPMFVGAAACLVAAGFGYSATKKMVQSKF
jgi:MFS family permease